MHFFCESGELIHVGNYLRAELIVRTPATDLSRRRIPVPTGTIVRAKPGVLIKKAPCATNGEFLRSTCPNTCICIQQSVA